MNRDRMREKDSTSIPLISDKKAASTVSDLSAILKKKKIEDAKRRVYAASERLNW